VIKPVLAVPPGLTAQVIEITPVFVPPAPAVMVNHDVFDLAFQVIVPVPVLATLKLAFPPFSEIF